MSRSTWDAENYDIFVSYARRDDADGMVSALIDRIRDDFARFSPAFPLQVFFDRDDIHDLSDWQSRLRHGLERSKVMLAVLSPHYFASDWCRREWETYREFERSRTYPGESIAPIFVVAPSDLERRIPPSERPWWDDLAARQGVEAQSWWPHGRVALQRDEVAERLERLERAVAERVEFGRRLASVPRNLRPRNGNFTGRLDELRELRDKLSRFEMAGVCAVHGIGGMGKSTLAREYAWRFRPEYLGGQFEIDLSGLRSSDELQSQLVMLARDYLEADIPLLMPLSEAFPRARAQFERRATENPILLILDNLNERDAELVSVRRRGDLLPSSDRLHVLVTTRLGPGRLGGLQTVTLDALSSDDALGLFFRYRELACGDRQPALLPEPRPVPSPDSRAPDPEDAEWKAALALVNRLGRHTLAVELVAAFLGQNREILIAEFLKEVEQHDIGTALDAVGRDERVRQFIAHPETLVGPLFERTLKTLSPLEERILGLAARLPADDVPVSWVETICREDASLADTLARKPFRPDPWTAALKNLDDLRLLVRPSQDAPTARMHRVVQSVLRDRPDESTRAAWEESLRDMADRRRDALGRTQVWTAVRWEIQVLERFASDREADADSRLGWCEVVVAGGHRQLGDLAGSARNAESALARFERLAAANPGSPQRERDLSVALNSLGDAHFQSGRFSDAESFYERSLAITRRLTESNPTDELAHDDLSIALDRLGDIRMARRDYEDARAFYERSLALREQWAARDASADLVPRNIGVSLQKIGRTRSEVGDRPQALILFERFRSLAEKRLERDPGDVEACQWLALSLSLMADLSDANDDLPAAVDGYRRNIEILARLASADPENALLRRSISVASFRLGELTGRLGDHAAARSHLERSYAITEQLAEHDPRNAVVQADLRTGAERLGELCFVSDDLLAAWRHFGRCVELRERDVAADPNDVAAWRMLGRSLSQIIETCLAVGDFQAAREHLERCLRTVNRVAELSPDEPDLVRSRAAVFEKLGRAHLLAKDRLAARDAFQRSLGFLLQMAEPAPNDESILLGLAQIHEKLGNVCADLADHEAAGRHYALSEEASLPLVDAYPDDVPTLEGFAWVLAKQGDLYRSLREFALAARFYERRLAVLRRLADMAGPDSDAARWLALSCHRLAETLAEAGDHERAAAAMIPCHAYFEGRATDEPDNTSRQRDLWVSHSQRAWLFRRSGSLDEEIAALRKCLAVFDDFRTHGWEISPADRETERWLRDRLAGLAPHGP